MSKSSVLIRLPEELAQELQELAEQLGNSRNQLISEAIRFYLAERADLDLALDRLRDPNADWLTHEEARRELLGD